MIGFLCYHVVVFLFDAVWVDWCLITLLFVLKALQHFSL